MSVSSVSETATERYARGVIRWRWPVLLASIVLIAAAGMGAARLKFIDEYRVFFGPDNPQLLAFDAVENIYTKNDNLFFLIEPPGDHGDAFTAETLSIVEYLTDEAWRIPFAIRVDSVSNFQYSWAEGDDLIVEDLVVGAEAKTPAELARTRDISLDEPMLRDRLVPPATDVIGLSVTLQLPRLEMDETSRAVARGRELATEIEQTHPGYRIRLTGMAMLNNAFQESAMRDMSTLVPFMYVVITLTLVLLLRSFTGTVSTLTVVGMSVVGALGPRRLGGTQPDAAVDGLDHDDHDVGRGGQHSHPGRDAQGDAPRPREARGDCRESAGQHAAGVPDQPDDGDWLPQHELQRSSAAE